jgi:hypothetical protein
MPVKAMICGFALIAIAAPSAMAQTPPAEQNTCSAYNAECIASCTTLGGDTKKCVTECDQRQQQCLTTGIYERVGKPPAMKLIPR